MTGALAVPLHAVATPVSAAVAGLVGLLGLHAWRWSRLPLAIRSRDQSAPWRLLQGAAWMALGLLVGLLLLGVIRIVIEPVIPAMGARIATAGALPVWRRVLVIYVAAVGEEVLFRLVLFSLVAGLAARLLRAPSPMPGPAIIWVANIVSALVFAAAHLPSWSGAGSQSPWLLVSVLALNAAGSVVFGYVFATRGIVAAMLTHAGADCAIQLIGPITG